MDTLTLRREGEAVRLLWQIPYLDDGGGRAARYNVCRRVRGLMAPFLKLPTTTTTDYLDTASSSGQFEYEVTAVMN